MALSFVGILPHAPELLGTTACAQLAATYQTCLAIRTLAQRAQAVQPEIVVVVSAAGPEGLDAPAFAGADQLTGNLAAVGDTTTSVVYRNALPLVDELRQHAKSVGIRIALSHELVIPEGALVPLLLTKLTPPPDADIPQLVLLFHTFGALAEQWNLGELVGRSLAARPERIALLASADLSHRLRADSPAGYSPNGAAFDAAVITALKTNAPDSLMQLDPAWVAQAGEDGLRAIIIALAAARSVWPDATAEVLSYEAPLGVGYVVAALTP